MIASFINPRNNLFHRLTRRWRADSETRHPELVRIADLVRDELVAIEMRRGDLPTPTTLAARNIGSVTGIDVVVTLMETRGKANLQRWSVDLELLILGAV